VLYLTGGTHPDHDSINTFRQRFLPQFERLFVQVLLIAHELGVVKLGEVSLDGTKIEANASKHHAMSWAYAERLEQQLKAEVQTLLERAAAVDGPGAVDIDLPAELKRREDRLAKIAKSKRRSSSGRKPGMPRNRRPMQRSWPNGGQRAGARSEAGRQTAAGADAGPRSDDQVNFTDAIPGSCRCPVGASNRPTMPSDRDDGEPADRRDPRDPEHQRPTGDGAGRGGTGQAAGDLGCSRADGADNGYCSAHNVEILVTAGIEPLIAVGRQSHHDALAERLAPVPDAPPNPDAVTAMKHRLKTPEGKALYARRKTTSEPVFGIIKEGMGFRRFLLRGLAAVQGEWRLVCLAFNLKRLFVLQQGLTAS